MIKIIHIISSLTNGGAERTLSKLIEENINNPKIVQVILCFTNKGHYGDHFEQLGIKLYCLNMSKSVTIFTKIIKIFLIINKEKPQIIQTWMYHADLIGVLIGKLMRIKKIYWNIRSNDLIQAKYSLTTVLIGKICSQISWLPTKIVCCSQNAIENHVKMGYLRSKFIYIPNGYDSKLLYPNPSLSRRNHLNLNSELYLIGAVGKFDSQKDFSNLFHALSYIKHEKFLLIMLGKDLSRDNLILCAEIKMWGLEDRVLLLGAQNDMLSWYNTFDFFVLSSRSEGFPNVVAEAAFCGVPCIVTDVGDAGLIVGANSIIVPRENSEELSKAIMQFLSLERLELSNIGKLCRDMIVENYSLSKMIDSYNKLYTQIES